LKPKLNQFSPRKLRMYFREVGLASCEFDRERGLPCR
jgi:hypothetical protein